MRCCKGQATVKCLIQSKHTWSWCQKWVWFQSNWTPLMTQKQVVVTIVDTEFKSQPCPTIHHTFNESLEGSSCWERLDSTQTLSNLVWIVGVWNQNYPQTWLKSIEEWSSYWEMLDLTQTHSSLVWIVGFLNVQPSVGAVYVGYVWSNSYSTALSTYLVITTDVLLIETVVVENIYSSFGNAWKFDKLLDCCQLSVKGIRTEWAHQYVTPDN